MWTTETTKGTTKGTTNVLAEDGNFFSSRDIVHQHDFSAWRVTLG
jgi:hypothetical protein